MSGIAARPVDIVIAEKNPLLQSSLVRLFGDRTRFRVVAIAPDGERFLETVERVPFDVGIIGWEMPAIDGRGVLLTLRRKPHVPRIVVYSGSANPDVPRQAMALGAAGFCSKTDPPASLLDTIQAVASGRMVFPFIDVARLTNTPFTSLTPREREMLAALAGGLTNHQMAQQLGISLNTVKFHLKNLYEKLGVTNRAQAVAHYLQGREGRAS